MYTNGGTEGLCMGIAVVSVGVMSDGVGAGVCGKQDASCIQCACWRFSTVKKMRTSAPNCKKVNKCLEL